MKHESAKTLPMAKAKQSSPLLAKNPPFIFTNKKETDREIGLFLRTKRTSPRELSTSRPSGAKGAGDRRDAAGGDAKHEAGGYGNATERRTASGGAWYEGGAADGERRRVIRWWGGRQRGRRGMPRDIFDTGARV